MTADEGDGSPTTPGAAHPPRSPKYVPLSSDSTSPRLQRKSPLKQQPHSKYRSSKVSAGKRSAAFLIRVPPRLLQKYALRPRTSRLAFRGPFQGLWGEFSGPDEVAEIGRRHIHDLGERPLGDPFLQELPDLPFLAVKL